MAAELLAKAIATAISDVFGLRFTVQPAQLTELGEKLLGAKPW